VNTVGEQEHIVGSSCAEMMGVVHAARAAIKSDDIIDLVIVLY